MADTSDKEKMRVCVAGGAGFIGSHLAKRLKDEGHHIVVVDWKKNEFMENEEFCNEFLLLDLRVLKNCIVATKGCDWVFNLAADMGGMGFIASNESVLMFNNTLVSSNTLEASRRNKVSRYFYSSSACVYNEKKQLDPNNPGLVESDTWPAWPQDTYGLEKLYAEEMVLAYGRDFDNLETRIARFHNIYGPRGTWRGGREKAPAAFCRKGASIEEGGEFEIWGDGLQTRSFCYIDDCVEGILRIMRSDNKLPLNLGSDEMWNMNDMVNLVLSFDNKQGKVNKKHIPGPQGVRGRNSDNTLIRDVLGWAPSIELKDGLNRTYIWIKDEIAKCRKDGNKTDFTKSSIVKQTTETLDQLGDAIE